ncbi:MAG: hypothetical protein JXA99_10755 [Candidatus Lokiarchaeota archaeon]|nr:hypothetical protein [Candidatus Lokiarchaeota archaeon]
MISNLIAIFMILVGLLMIGFWIFLLINREEEPELMKEIKDTPYMIKLHIIAEFTTALFSILSGLLFLVGIDQLWIFIPISLGMIFFASLQALVSYATDGDIMYIIMLGIITFLALLAIIFEISLGFNGNIPGSEQPSEILGIWIFVAICLGMSIYIVIQTIGVELHFGKRKKFDRYISLIVVLLFLLILIAILSIFIS